jgi:rhodanese-related sulfurtransferase
MSSDLKRKNKKRESIRSWIVMVMVGVLLAAVAVAVFLDDSTAAARFPNQVTVQQAYEMREVGAFILDVRTVEEWEEFHIPGAVLIPLDELPQRVREVPSDLEVVVVCRSGNRSAVGRDILKQAGFANVTSMAGGVVSWKAAGFPVEAGP